MTCGLEATKVQMKLSIYHTECMGFIFGYSLLPSKIKVNSYEMGFASRFHQAKSRVKFRYRSRNSATNKNHHLCNTVLILIVAYSV